MKRSLTEGGGRGLGNPGRSLGRARTEFLRPNRTSPRHCCGMRCQRGGLHTVLRTRRTAGRLGLVFAVRPPPVAEAHNQTVRHTFW